MFPELRFMPMVLEVGRCDFPTVSQAQSEFAMALNLLRV
jgi:hypothetical protein